MSSNLLTYAPEDVIILLSSHQLTGIETVNLEWLSKPFTMVQGIRGVHTRVYNPNMAATLTLDVLQTSETNDILSAVLQADRMLRSARCTLSLYDKSGSTAIAAEWCYIPNYPNVKFLNGLEVRSWTIDLLNVVDVNVGGNAKQAFDIFSSVQGAIDYLGDAAGTALDSASDALSSIKFG